MAPELLWTTMEILRIYVLPLVLALGAVLLLAIETRTIQLELQRKTPQWWRFIRRTLGALTIAAIGFMLHFGNAPPTLDEVRGAGGEERVWGQYSYWITVLGLVGLAVVLAVWDVLASIRLLRQQFERLERDELARLQEQIRQKKR